jgi:hypothetical protein
MPVLHTLVLLLAFPGARGFGPPRDAAFFDRFWFHPADGQRAFWDRESTGDVLVHGRVVELPPAADLNWDLIDRAASLQLAIRTAEETRGVDFGPHNMVVLVVSVPPGKAVNDGSVNPVRSSHTHHHGILATDTSRFDFVAHEVGHALGLDHSYGPAAFKDTWGMPGEYGHPFCVMSAQAYGFGGSGPGGGPATAARPEYVGRCPSVNAATARARGWLDAHITFAMAGPPEFVIASRHRARRGTGTPAVVEIRAPGGDVFAVEFRGEAPWDLGQAGPTVIVSHGTGSTADVGHPGTHSATWIGHVTAPVAIGSPASVVNAGPFAVELADLAGDRSWARVRVTPGSAAPGRLELRSTLRLRRSMTVESGVTAFATGERLCVHGTWPYDRVANIQTATFEATYARALPGAIADWSVDGQALTGPSGTVTYPTSVRIAGAKLTHTPQTRSVTLAYEIAPIPGGSRLTLENDPDDETFAVHVQAELHDRVARGSADG